MIVADRIDLLPGFVGARRRARRMLAASTVVACVAGSACALAFVAQGFGLTSAQRELSVQQASNAALATQVAELSDLEVLQARLQTQQMALETLFQGEVRWSTILADLQAVMPSDTWLTGMTANLTPPTTEGDTLSSKEIVGKIDFQATTLSHPDVADWLQRLDRVPAFDSPYVTIASKTEVGNRTVVSFSSSVLVTSEALRGNQPGGSRIR